ncbi:MAG: hypothetical protein ACTHK4_00020 [Mycobacteriales bacterium]
MAARASVRSWWLTSPVMTAGAVADCGAYAMSRTGVAGAAPLYWLGQVALVLPCIIICLRRTATGHSRLWALQLLAALQALLAWAYSPDRFRFPDEMQHLRTAHDIVHYGHLFVVNPMLPVSPGFPALEIVTTALSQVSGMSLFAAGIITSSVAHIVLVTAVFAWARALRLGPRRAAASALVYGFAPDFAYFDSLFTYTAIAAPFFILAMRATARALTRRDGVLLIAPPLFLAIVAHHLTGYLACAFVALAAVLVRRTARRDLGPALIGMAGAGLVAAALWTYEFAPHAFNYLLTPTRVALLALVSPDVAGAGDAAVRGIGPPLWERLLGVLGALMMTAAAFVGARMMWQSAMPRWVRRFSWAALVYPIVLGIRLIAADGPEIAGRLLLYGMLLTCVPVALVLVALWGDGRSRRGVGVAVVVTGIIAAGAVVSATPPSWERLPGTFHVAADESGVDSRVTAAAAYAGKSFFPYASVACDRILCSVVGGDTEATPNSESTPMFYGDDVLRHAVIGRLDLDYVMVDDRLARQRPATGLYFAGEGGTGTHPRPFPAERLAAFATDPAFGRVYDNGDIQVYDVTAVWHV